MDCFLISLNCLWVCRPNTGYTAHAVCWVTAVAASEQKTTRSLASSSGCVGVSCNDCCSNQTQPNILKNFLQSVSTLRLKLKLCLVFPLAELWNFLWPGNEISYPNGSPAKDTDHLCYQLDLDMKHLPLLKNPVTSKG